ncbi:MAG: Mg2+ and Co2+ transporter CorB [Christensenellaceae bacterium]|jgi:hypothetical protein|nr:Mg2+ and Co2+ transporter CorB [Christensenellaceae bacterium]
MVYEPQESKIMENKHSLQTVDSGGITPEKKEVKADNKKAPSKKRKNAWGWALKLLVIAMVVGFLFGIGSEILLVNASIYISSVIVILLIIIAIVFDMAGVATVSCDKEPLMSMAARKVKGAKEAIFLVKNNEKVTSIFNDVIGDICGIVSGAAGATIVLALTEMTDSPAFDILIASSVSAIIAGLTIFGKALGKRYAIKSSTKILLNLGKILATFTRNKS